MYSLAGTAEQSEYIVCEIGFVSLILVVGPWESANELKFLELATATKIMLFDYYETGRSHKPIDATRG